MRIIETIIPNHFIAKSEFRSGETVVKVLGVDIESDSKQIKSENLLNLCSQFQLLMT